MTIKNPNKIVIQPKTDPLSKGLQFWSMRTIVQVEYRRGLLTVREEILQFLGHPVVSVFGSQAARQLDFSNKDVGVVLIGHGAPWEERSQLIEHFKQSLPGTLVIASLRQSDSPSPVRTLIVPPTTRRNGSAWSGKHLQA